jgi:hypothetical protein
MPDWTTQGGPGAGQDPKGGRKVLAFLLLGVVLGVIAIKLGWIK